MLRDLRYLVEVSVAGPVDRESPFDIAPRVALLPAMILARDLKYARHIRNHPPWNKIDMKQPCVLDPHAASALLNLAFVVRILTKSHCDPGDDVRRRSLVRRPLRQIQNEDRVRIKLLGLVNRSYRSVDSKRPLQKMVQVSAGERRILSEESCEIGVCGPNLICSIRIQRNSIVKGGKNIIQPHRFPPPRTAEGRAATSAAQEYSCFTSHR